ncbi:MAG: hypothetical protein BMS9Abin29_0152 [Gemmatimonadota bacterium]|nr:MAG: hypothetical protein BMS9Abin29_0152 [Gemmatimonadota bacterium]
MRTLIVVASLLFFATPALAQARGELGIALGEVPELVEIEDLDGTPVDLARFVGEKPVLFEFWARWCENCLALKPQLDAVAEAYEGRVNFVAIAVAVAQSPRSVKRYLEKEPVPFPTIWDTRGRAVRAFLAPATSYVAILDTDGRVIYTGIGPEQNIEAAVLEALNPTQ